MIPAKPSLDLLRSLSDEHVLRALMDRPHMTRAELAGVTGISKPTVSGSVARLVEAGLVEDTGERTTGPGRAGSYYALAADVGSALVISIAPEGIVAETVTASGSTTSRSEHEVTRPATPARVRKALVRTVADALLTAELEQGAEGPNSTRASNGARQSSSTGGARRPGRPARLAVVTAADPVDRATGRLVHLPDAPFLVGSLDPVGVLSAHVTGPVVVDNDVNWAARAERQAAGEGRLEDFGYLHLGDGLGCAVVNDGRVLRGARGLAGEVAHLVTYGPGGEAMPFTAIFQELGLRRPGSAAVDSDALLQALDVQPVRAAVAAAVSGVVAALTALADPEVVLLGGTWGLHAGLLTAVREALKEQPRRPRVAHASVAEEPSLAGARRQAIAMLRDLLVEASRSPAGQPATP